MTSHEQLESFAALVAMGDTQALARGQWEALLDHVAQGCDGCRDILSTGEMLVEAAFAEIPVREDAASALRVAVRNGPVDDDHTRWDVLRALDAAGMLGEGELAALRQHMAAGCSRCSDVTRAFNDATDSLADEIVPLAPSDAASARIKAAVRAGEARPSTVESVEPRADAAFVGRDAELGMLEAALERLRRGDGGFLAITGDAGVGKSRLLAEFGTLAEARGVHPVVARAVPVARALGFGAAREILDEWCGVATGSAAERARGLQELVDELPSVESGDVLPYLARLTGCDEEAGTARDPRIEVMSGQALERATMAAFDHVLTARAARVPQLIVVEDLHWADDTTVSQVDAWLDLVTEHPVLVVALSRPNGQAHRRLADSASARIPLHYRAIDLGPISAAESVELARSMNGGPTLPEALHRLVLEKAEGNPLYVEEVVRSFRMAGEPEAGEAAAKGVAPVILSRVDALDATARTVIEIAAVLGRRFEASVLEHVAGPDVDVGAALETLEEARFVESSSDRGTSSARVVRLHARPLYRFHHALLQESVLGSIPPERRRNLHGACADAIESVHGDELRDHLAALAYQCTNAGREQKAIDYLLSAGELAAGSAATHDALHFFKRAYDSFEQHGARDRGVRARIERNFALALLNTGHLAESLEHFNEALRLHGEWVPEGKIAVGAKLLRDLSEVLIKLYTDGLARNAQPATEEEKIVFELLYNRCRAQNIVDNDRRVADTVAAIRHVGHLAPETVDNSVGILASAGAFFAFAGISFDPSQRFLRLAAEFGRSARNADRFSERAMASVVNFLSGDWSRENDIDPDLLDEGLRAGLLWDADVYLGFACERSILQARFADALSHIDALAQLSDRWGYGFARSNEIAMRAFLALTERRLGEARDLAEHWRALRGEAPIQLLALGIQARVATLTGDIAGAQAALEAAAPLAANSFPFYAGIYRTALADFQIQRWVADHGSGEQPRAPRVLGRPPRAVKNAVAAAVRSATKCARDRAEAHRLAGRMAALSGDTTAARRAFEASLLSCEELDRPLERARTLVAMAEALAPLAGDPKPELSHLDEAASIFERLGAEWDLERLGRVRSLIARAA